VSIPDNVDDAYARLADAPGSEDRFHDFVNAWLAPRTADYILSAWGSGHSNAAAMSAMIAEFEKIKTGF